MTRLPLLLVTALATLLLVSGLAAEVSVIEPLDPDHPEAGLRLTLVFDHQPRYRIHRHERRTLVIFDELSRQQVRASLGDPAWHAHPLIERAAVAQPNGQPVALALELAADLSPQARLHSANGRHYLVVELARLNSTEDIVPPSRLPQDRARAVSVDNAPEPAMDPAPPASAPQSLVDVRIAPRNGGARLVIETRRPLAFRMRSAGPGRQVVLELEGMDAEVLAPALAGKLAADHRLIDALAVNGGQPGQARLELTLRQSARATVFNLEPDNGFAHRLVIDLVPEAAAPARPDPVPEPAPPSATPAETPTPETEPAPERVELLWLEATLNQQRRRHTVLARRAGDRLWLGGGDLGIWALRLPDEAHLQDDGESWYELDRLGIEYRLDSRRLTLDMTAPARLFAAHAMAARGRERLEPTPSPPGAFFNYDISATHSGGDSNTSGLFELGAFNGWGTLTSSGITRHGDSVRDQGMVRLDTSLRRDWPGRMRTLVLGDTLTRGTAWSGGVRFGGVQWSNNFELQPELITLPLLSMGGEAALPSTIEVYINEALRLRESVEPGPFDIDQIPVVTGTGQATVIVTDILGRQQVITRDFYASHRLLRAGLHDFSWELGAVRENYGIDDFDYGRGFASATHRYGFSNRLTGEFHAQHTEDHTTAGAGMAWLLPFGGVVDAAAAHSNSDDGSGSFASLGLQRQGQRLSAGISSQFAEADFTRLGMIGDRSLPARQLRAHASMRAFSNGTLSLSYTEQRLRERDNIEFLTLRLSQRIAGVGFLNLSAAHYFDSGDNAVTASLSIPLDQPRTSASVGASWREDRQYGSASLRRNLPVGTGYGYNLQLRAGDGSFQRGGVAWQNDYGTWRAEASHRSGTTATRGQASGGLAWLGGEVFAARSIRDSFGVVQVPGFEGVRVYAENQQVGRTNARGNALVPRMRPYQRNRLRIEQADLPLGANIDSLEAEVAPYWRSGVVVDFPVRRTRDAFFRILLEDGEPLPLGAAIYDQAGEVWPVGHRGETFITGLAEHNRFHVRHNGESCEFELSVPDSDDPLPDLGTVTCRESR